MNGSITGMPQGPLILGSSVFPGAVAAEYDFLKAMWLLRLRRWDCLTLSFLSSAQETEIFWDQTIRARLESVSLSKLRKQL